MESKTSIAETIRLRAEIAGWSQAKLAEAVECTPNQMSQFLKGKSSLNIGAIDKCCDVLGLPLKSMVKRIELAKKAAAKLSHCSIEEISSMSRKEMVDRTGFKSILALPVVSKQEFEMMMESGICDYECTFQYFKTLVLHFIQTSAHFTPKSVETSLLSLSKSIFLLSTIPVFGIGSIIAAGIMALASKNSKFSKALDNAWGTLTTLTDSIFEKENKNKQ